MNLRAETVAKLAELIRRMTIGDIRRDGVAAELRDLAEKLDPTHLTLRPPDVDAAAAQATKESAALNDAWLDVFRYWQRATGKSRAKASPERKRSVLARLRQGYTVTDLKRAIDGCLMSDHHVEGGYVDLTLICRNASKVEGFVEKAGDRPAYGGASGDDMDDDPETMRLESESMAALAAGQTKLYEKLQAELARRKEARR